jgi:hypothetical protein
MSQVDHNLDLESGIHHRMMNGPIQMKTLISVIMMKHDEGKRNKLCGKQFIES